MDSWGVNPNTFQAIGSIGVVIALIGVVLSSIQNIRSRNMEGSLQIFFDFRDRWEASWERILREQTPLMDLEQRHTGEVGQQLAFMLNWLNWMGLMVENKWIDKKVLLGSLQPVIVEILKQTAHQIQSDVDVRGDEWWNGVLYMAKQRGIRVDIHEEAIKLRAQWEWGSPGS